MILRKSRSSTRTSMRKTSEEENTQRKREACFYLMSTDVTSHNLITYSFCYFSSNISKWGDSQDLSNCNNFIWCTKDCGTYFKNWARGMIVPSYFDIYFPCKFKYPIAYVCFYGIVDSTIRKICRCNQRTTWRLLHPSFICCWK